MPYTSIIQKAKQSKEINYWQSIIFYLLIMTCSDIRLAQYIYVHVQGSITEAKGPVNNKIITLGVNSNILPKCST